MTIECGEWVNDVNKPKDTSYIKGDTLVRIKYTIEHRSKDSSFSKRLVTHTTYNGYETLQEARMATAIALNSKGDTKLEAKDYKGALQNYDAATRISPENALYHYNKAFAFYRLGCYSEAIISAEEALKIDSHYKCAENLKACALNDRGNNKFKAKDYGGALQDYDTSIGINYKNALYHSNRALALKMLNRYDEAIASAHEALRIDQHYQRAKIVKASALNERGSDKFEEQDYKGALQDYESALRVVHKKALYHSNRALALNMLNRHDEAIASAQEALRLDPHSHYVKDMMADFLNDRGCDRFEAKHYKGALQDYEAAINLDSKEVIYSSNMAWALIKLGRYGSALNQAQKALSLDPGYELANFADTLARASKADVEKGDQLIRESTEYAQKTHGEHDAAVCDQLIKQTKRKVQLAMQHYEMCRSRLPENEATDGLKNRLQLACNKLNRYGLLDELYKNEKDPSCEDKQLFSSIEALIDCNIALCGAYNMRNDIADSKRSLAQLQKHITRIKESGVKTISKEVIIKALEDVGKIEDCIQKKMSITEPIYSGSASLHRKYIYGEAIEEYSTASMNQLLDLRLSKVVTELLEAQVVMAYSDINIKAISYKSTSYVKVLPILIPSMHEVELLHWVGMIFESNSFLVKISYLDSENQKLHEDLKRAITNQLEILEPTKAIYFEQLEVEQQKYNNCGPELIENMALYFTGVRVSQENSMLLHSLLYASYLINENLTVEKAIAMVRADPVNIAPLYYQERGVSFDVKAWLSYAIQWTNDKIDPYLKQFLEVSKYRELQDLADKYSIGIEVVDQITARKAFKKISLVTHPDKVLLSDNANLEEKQYDYLRAEKLSSDKPNLASDLWLYAPVMSQLETIYQGIKIVDSVVDTVKAIRNPDGNTISNAIVGYGYIAETFFGKTLGMKYIAPINIGLQLYKGDYDLAMRSSLLLGGHILPNMLMSLAPALAVTLKAGCVLKAAYDTSMEIYNELSCYKFFDSFGVAVYDCE